MSQDPTDTELDRLLSGGGLSALEEESILEHVLKESGATDVEGAPRTATVPVPRGPDLLGRIRAWFILPPALAGAAAAIFFFANGESFSLPGSGLPGTGGSGFSSRGHELEGGESTGLEPVILRCEGGCKGGSSLVLSWQATEDSWTSAVAAGPEGATLWLFSGEPVKAGTRLAWEAQLPADAAAGEWTLYLLVMPSSSPRPTKDLSRYHISGFVNGRDIRPHRVVPQPFTLDAATP